MFVFHKVFFFFTVRETIRVFSTLKVVLSENNSSKIHVLVCESLFTCVNTQVMVLLSLSSCQMEGKKKSLVRRVRGGRRGVDAV